MSSLTVEAPSDAHVALRRACEHLLSLPGRRRLVAGRAADERDDGRRGHAPARVSRHAPPEETERSAAWIRSQQRADGTWANFHGGPGELSTTIEAYWALRLAGDAAEAEHMRRAAAFVRAQGGIERARVFTHVWLALFGLWSWDERARAAARDRAAARMDSAQRLRLRVLGAPDDRRAVARQSPPAGASAGVRAGRAALGAEPPAARAPGSWHGRLLAELDRVLRAYERRPIGALRRLALGRAERWIVRRQEADGSWGGIQPPWVYSLMALHLGGYPLTIR